MGATARIIFRVEPALKERLEAAAIRNRKTLTAWALSALAAAADGRPVYTAEERAELADIKDQLRRAGIVLNQLVRIVNRYDHGTRQVMALPDDREWLEALRAMQAATADINRKLGLLS